MQLQQFALAREERASSQWASGRELCCSSEGTLVGRVESGWRVPIARAAASPAKARALAQSMGPNGEFIELHYTITFERTIAVTTKSAEVMHTLAAISSRPTSRLASRKTPTHARSVFHVLTSAEISTALNWRLTSNQYGAIRSL